METVYDGELQVSYSQFYVDSRDDDAGLEEPRAGQRNGLCGAAVPGHLFLTTGLHTGPVWLTVETHERRPPLDDAWEEAVEAPFRPMSPSAAVVPWGDGPLCEIDLSEPSYRVRYCARGMGEAREREIDLLEEDIVVDRYLLQFWPAPPTPDEILKQTTRQAAYWHEVARELPPPPSPEERAEAVRRERERAEREARIRLEEYERREWGGRLPSERLRRARNGVYALRDLDPALVHAVDDAGPHAQRAIAGWAARRAYAEAGLDGIGWIAPALAALDEGAPLPAPFDGDGDGHADDSVWERLWTDPAVPHTVVDSTDGGRKNVLQQAMAFPALRCAAQRDPLQAALDALADAVVTFGSGYPRVFTEVRREFGLPG